MKKTLSRITLFALLIVMIMSLVACNTEGGNGSSDRENIDSETFTVTFDSNGGSTMNPKSVTVPYAGKISEPTQKPTKSGYTFDGWFKGDNKFNFEENSITSNTILVAKWSPLILNIDAQKNINNIKFEANGKEYIPYSIKDTLNTDGSLKEEYKYTSQNNQKNYHPILVLLEKGKTLDNKDSFDPNDYFVYFYEIQNEKEVRFTTWAKKPTSSIDYTNKDISYVQELSTYTSNKDKKLYAKWHSELPNVIVDTSNDTSIATNRPSGIIGKFHDDVKSLQDIITGDKAPTRNGETITEDGVNLNVTYTFDGWSFKKGDKNWEKLPISGNSGVLDEYYLDKQIGTDNKETGNYTLTLKANWKKVVTINSVSDFENFSKIVSSLQTKVNSDVKKDDTSVELLNSFTTAKILFNSDSEFNFNGLTFRPMFTNEYPFKGEIASVKTTDDNVVKTKLINITLFNKKNNVSLFGVLDGAKINGIIFEDFHFGLSTDTPPKGEELTKDNFDYLNVAVIANLIKNNSSIKNCEFIATKNNSKALDFSHSTALTLQYGIVASVLDASVISDCTVNVEIGQNVDIQSTSNVFFGALVGQMQNKSSIVQDKLFGDIKRCIVEGTFLVTSNIDDPTNRPSAYVGGLVGKMDYCGLSSNKFKGKISVDSHNTYLGGLVGYMNNSQIHDSYAEDLYLIVGGKDKNKIISEKNVFVGGLIGNAINSTTTLSNSYVRFKEGIEIHASKDCNVYTAALAGNLDKSKLTKSFSLTAPIKVHIYDENRTELDLGTDDKTNNEALANVLNKVHIGYLFFKEPLDSISAVSNCYYVRALNAEGLEVENIYINNIRHKLEKKKESDQAEEIVVSNFRIKLFNIGTSIKESEWNQQNKIYTNVSFDSTIWNWSFDPEKPEEGYVRTYPTLKFETASVTPPTEP